MKYYEFNIKDFEYYALIGDYSMECAMKLYSENICDIKNNITPDEVSEEYMLERLNEVVGYIPDNDLVNNSYGLLLIDNRLI